MKYLLISLCVVAAIFLILLAVSLYVFQDTFVRDRASKLRAPKKKNSTASRFMKDIDWESIGKIVDDARERIKALPHFDAHVKSYDGLDLFGQVFELEGAERTIIAFHGYKSNRFGDFASAFFYYRSRGFNIVMVDQRSHGESEGKYITFGVKERYDCLKWIEYVNSLSWKKQKIYITGISMGASTVEMASELDLPENVCGIIGDCGFSTPYDIVENVGRRMVNIPLGFVLLFVDMWCRLIAGFSLHGASVPKALSKNTKIPLLLIHGEEDGFVPHSMGVENYNACAAPKMMLSVKGADHGVSYLVSTEEYKKTLDDFIALSDKVYESKKEPK